MKKCRYCGKELNSNFEFCSNECENSYRKIIEKDRQKIKYFMIGIILGFLVMFYGITLNSDFIIGIGIIVMGIDVVVLPFTTPETTTFLGYRKSKVKSCRKNTWYITYSGWIMGRACLITNSSF